MLKKMHIIKDSKSYLCSLTAYIGDNNEQNTSQKKRDSRTQWMGFY